MERVGTAETTGRWLRVSLTLQNNALSSRTAAAREQCRKPVAIWMNNDYHRERFQPVLDPLRRIQFEAIPPTSFFLAGGENFTETCIGLTAVMGKHSAEAQNVL